MFRLLLQLAQMLEVPVCILPSCLLRWRVLEPMLYQCKGTITAAELAVSRGAAINLGGGKNLSYDCFNSVR